jgi:DNA-binding NarL/FixJ family response regulator
VLPQSRLSVLIADDDGLFARALEALLDVEPSISIVGCALDGDEAARLAAQLLPDVILMDLSMPRVDGFDATKRIRELVPETAIVVLTGSRDDADVARAKDAGAAGYVTKDRILGELVDAIHAAANAA